MASDNCSMLYDRLAGVLPEGYHFTIHHLSTPPTLSHSLYAAPPGELAEETYCESHFLSVSIDADGHDLQVFAIEILIYSTESLTTLFVSKADSTGYLYLLRLPSGCPSPLKSISTTFLQYLVDERQRNNRRLVLSLFARAQNQYLFPGSIENSHKHVLDDRGLIKWWCKIVDPILRLGQNDSDIEDHELQCAVKDGENVTSRGYLRVPGCDTNETRTLLPKDERNCKAEQHRWKTSDPLCELGRSPELPERCLIPRFPDDPKARFVEQLDDELPEEDSSYQSQDRGISPTKQNTGRWRSVRSLEQFWDMMSFRQECSSGRLVGFLWATFQPASLLDAERVTLDRKRSGNSPELALPTPDVSQHQNLPPLTPQSPLRSSPALEIPSTPSKETFSHSQQTPAPTPQKKKEAAIRSKPEETNFYYWPKTSRGEVVLRQKDYQRAGNLLLRLDYANQEIALDSSRKWVQDICNRAGVERWGRLVAGTLAMATKADVRATVADPTILNAGLIRKKKRPAAAMDALAVSKEAEDTMAGVNTFSTGLIRKKTKVASSAVLLREEDPRVIAMPFQDEACVFSLS